MKTINKFTSAVASIMLLSAVASAGDKCTTIQSGELTDKVDNVITTGYDMWGYNYQAHIFNGSYCDAYRDAVWCQPYAENDLIMKWNDAWLSNKDCDLDGKLDRHYGSDTYRGSGAWLTNHESGKVEVDGKLLNWSYFTKIVAAPLDAIAIDGIWYTADDVEIGPVIWGQFAIIQEVVNDPSMGAHGVLYKGVAGSGLGIW